MREIIEYHDYKETSWYKDKSKKASNPLLSALAHDARDAALPASTNQPAPRPPLPLRHRAQAGAYVANPGSTISTSTGAAANTERRAWGRLEYSLGPSLLLAKRYACACLQLPISPDIPRMHAAERSRHTSR